MPAVGQALFLARPPTRLHMGRLARLELTDFKSYGGTVTVGPLAGFTAVIGSNGSGKSNLMDAISFVLGVRTTTLRGAALRDLIYRPPGGAAGGGGGGGHALRPPTGGSDVDSDGSGGGSDSGADEDAGSGDDGSDGGGRRGRARRVAGRSAAAARVAAGPVPAASRAVVKLVYANDEGAETTFSRTVSSRGSSAYRVDGVAVGVDAYHAALAEIGVVVRARNFLVFQNEVRLDGCQVVRFLTGAGRL